MPDTQGQIADLLIETAQEHHKAFIEDDGFDPEWPLWYSDYMMGKIQPVMGMGNDDLTRSELVYLLVLMDKQHKAKAPEAHWPDYYAQYLTELYS